MNLFSSLASRDVHAKYVHPRHRCSTDTARAPSSSVWEVARSWKLKTAPLGGAARVPAMAVCFNGDMKLLGLLLIYATCPFYLFIYLFFYSLFAAETCVLCDLLRKSLTVCEHESRLFVRHCILRMRLLYPVLQCSIVSCIRCYIVCCIPCYIVCCVQCYSVT